MQVILEVLSDYVEFDPETINRETDLSSELRLTSYDRISLLGDLERRLGIVVPEDRISQLTTLGEVADLLEELRG